MATRIMSLHQCDLETISDVAKLCGVTVNDIEDVYACTPLQLGMMADSSKRSGAYTYRLVLNLRQHVDTERYLDSFRTVVSQNSILRTRIADSAAGLLQVVTREQHQTLLYKGTTSQYLDEDRSRPIGVGQPLLRSALVERTLVITIHHAIGDQWSNLAFLSDVSRIYQQQQPDPHASYKDFVQNCWSINHQDADTFWRSRFKSIPTHFPAAIPHYIPNPTEHISKRIILDSSAANVSMALIPSYIEAAWALTAMAYTRSNSVAFGLVLSGRSPALGGLETTLGPTLVTVPVQMDLHSHLSIKDLLQERSRQRRQLQSHIASQYGLARIREVSAMARAAAEFQTLLSIRPTGDQGAGFAEFTVEKSDVVGPYGISLTATLEASGILLEASCDLNLLEKSQLQRVITHFEHSLRWLVVQPLHTRIDQYPTSNTSDMAEILAWNKDMPEPVERTLHSLFADQVASQRGRPAVLAADGNLSYIELDALSDQLSQNLLCMDLAVQEPVALIFEKSCWTIVAIMAILKAGGVCVPLDPSNPHARQLSLVTLAGARLILTSERHHGDCLGLSQQVWAVSTTGLAKMPTPSAQLKSRSTPSDLAYIMFTSGSTGQPKGVLLEHRSLASSLTRLASHFHWQSNTRTLQFAAYIWDASLLEIFGALIFGGCVCLPSQTERESSLASFMNSAKVTWALLTPTVLRTLAPDELPHLNTLASGGEAIDVEATRLWSSRLHFLNCYGPAEASIISTLATLSTESQYPQTIGRANGCATWIVDPDNLDCLLPIGATGELIVQGPNVARGYLDDNIKTSQAFITPPKWAPYHTARSTVSQRMYRTGDLVRYNVDGTICFVGRRDQQVKLRGQRFELVEVEASLLKCPGVQQAFVGLVTTAADHKDLAAVITPVGSTASDPHGLRIIDTTQLASVEIFRREVQSFANMHLPSHMVPTLWYAVSSMPQSASGKLDRKRIAAWLLEQDHEAAKLLVHRATTSALTAPTTRQQAALQAVWSSVLGVSPTDIGCESSFVGLGGDSISAMTAATRLRKQGFQIAVAALLASENLAQAAATCTTLEDLSTAPFLRDVTSTILSPVQRLFFDNNGPAAHDHFNHSWVLQLRSNVSAQEIEIALTKLVNHHAMLRARFREEPTRGWQQETSPRTDGAWVFSHHRDVQPCEVSRLVQARQTTINIRVGPVFTADLIEQCSGNRLLLLVAHHIVVDLVSWRVIWEDIETLVYQPLAHLSSSTPFLTWTEHQARSIPQTSSIDSWPKADLDFWDMQNKPALSGALLQHSFELGEAQTELIMGTCNSAYNTTPTELMLAAILTTFQKQFPDRGQPAVYCEGHGRPTGESALDVSRTVGWFTTLTPIVHAAGIDLPTIAMVKDSYRKATSNSQSTFCSQMASPQPLRWQDIEILFNFAGKLQQIDRRDTMLGLESHYSGQVLQVGDNVPQTALISISAAVRGNRLHFWVEYNREMAHQDRLRSISDGLRKELERCSVTLPALQPSLTLHDMPLLGAQHQDLPRIHKSVIALGVSASNIETILPCTPMQEGMLLAQSKGQEHAYLGRFIFKLSSKSSVDVQRVSSAWQVLCKTHRMLRTITASGMSSSSAFQQIVLKKAEPLMVHLEVGSSTDVCSVLKAYARPLLKSNHPAHRLTLASIPGSVYIMIDISHVLTDARTMQLLASQLQACYINRLLLPVSPTFDVHVAALQRNRQRSHKFWVHHLAGAQPTLLPRIGNRSENNAHVKPMAATVPFTDATEILAFCKQHSLTIANVAQVSWGLVLQQLTGSFDVLFGYLFSGREASEEAQNTVGPFINMLTCRIKSTSNTEVLELLEQAKANFSAGIENSSCVLGDLQDSLGCDSSPLFETAMSVQHAWTEKLAIETSTDLLMELQHVEDPTEFPLTVNLMYTNESFACKLFYQPDHLSEALVRDLASTYAAMIQNVIRNVHQSVATAHAAANIPSPTPFGLLPDRQAKTLKRQAAAQCEVSPGLVEDMFPTTPAQAKAFDSSVESRNSFAIQKVFKHADNTCLERLCEAWSNAIRATPALRTRIVSLHGYGTLQVVIKEPLHWSEDEDETLHDYLARDRQVSFRYGGRLVRLAKIMTGEDSGNIVISYHPSICDDTTFQQTQDLAEQTLLGVACQSQASASGFIRSTLASEVTAPSFWRSALVGLDEASLYPHAGSASTDTLRLTRSLSIQVSQQRHDILPLLHAAWALCLHRLTGNTKVRFGLAVDSRHGPWTGSATITGSLVATVPCVVTLTPTVGCHEFIEHLRQYATCVLPYAHNYTALSEEPHSNRIIIRIRESGTSGQSRTFMEPVDNFTTDQSGLPARLEVDCTIAMESVTIKMTTCGSSLTFEQIELALHQYEHAIAQLATSDGDSRVADLVSVSDHELALLSRWSGESLGSVDSCLHTLVSAFARNSPTAPAVRSWDRSLNYAELEVLSDKLAVMLQRMNIGSECVVPFFCEKSALAPVIMLGILKAGAIMLPLDITHPHARLTRIVQDAKASVVVSSSSIQDSVALLGLQILAVDFEKLEAVDRVCVQEKSMPSSGCYVISTSGSTGTPKMILVEHRNVASSITSHLGPLGITASTRLLQIATFAFDASIAEVFFPLLAGGCICMPSDAERSDNIAAAIVRTSANFSFMTPSMARLLTPNKVPTLRTLALMGEAMKKEDSELWKTIRLINAYGPAEAAIISACGDVDAKSSGSFTSIGRPHGCAFYVTTPDDHNILASIGAPGELIIQGPSVAREYLNDPEKTASAFIAAPRWTELIPALRETHSSRFYKTGDLVVRETNGTVTYLGRKGLQVKIRGQRVELSEVEHHLKMLLGSTVQLAVESVHAHGNPDDVRLIAFISDISSQGMGSSSTSGSELMDPQPGQAALLRDSLQKVLAPFMVPDVYVKLRSLPLSSSGKTDRKRMREVGATLTKEELETYSAFRKWAEDYLPRHDTPTAELHLTQNEFTVQKLWSEVLAIPQHSIAATDNFLAIGGNSIKAIQLVAAARDQGLQLTVADVFKFPVLSELAAVIRATAELESTIAPFTLLADSPDVESLRQDAAALCSIAPPLIEDIVPATALQQGLLAMASKRTGDYVAQMVMPLDVSVDLHSFKRAWESIVTSVPILRTRIIDLPGYGIVQAVLKEDVVWRQYVDLETDLAAELQLEMTLGSPLSRTGIHVDSVSGTQSLVLTLHHAIYDGWSMALLLDGVEDVYHNRRPQLASFKPYIRYINEQKATDVNAFWSSQFTGLEAPQFPAPPTADYSPRANEAFEHNVPDLHLQSSTVTMSTIVRTAWALLLSLYTCTPDAVFGAIVNGRQASVPDIEHIVGPTIATVPVRVRLDSSQIVETLLHHVQQQALDMIDFEQTGLQVIRDISSEARIACSFQTLLLVQPPKPLGGSQATNSMFVRNDIGGAAAFEAFSTYSIMLVCELQENGLKLRFAYDTNVVNHAQISNMSSQLDHLLRQLCSEKLRAGTVDDLPKISPGDLHDIWNWNTFMPETVEDCVHSMICKTAHLRPQAEAIHAWDGSLTYDGLDECSDTVAGHLSTLGVVRGDVLTLLFPKSMWTPVAALGVWKAGCTALLLDTALPKERLATIIAEANPRLMICATALAELAQSLAPALQTVLLDESSLSKMSVMEQSVELPTSHPSDVLYMVFTSGSTGVPKGALITHSNFASALHHQAKSIGLTWSSKVLDISAYSFDMAWYSMLHTLYSGACLCIPSDQERRDDISGAILRYGVTFVNTTPSLASTFDGAALRQLQTIELIGEVASRELLDRLRAHSLRPRNTYGPAECSAVVVSSDDMRTPSRIGSGSGAVTWLADPKNIDQLVPIGCIGELVLEGPLVGKGYLKPEQTAAAFVTNPTWLTQGCTSQPGRCGRLYRTGDLARYESDGNLTFLGRRDGQVKIRGQRVELAEIEYHIHALLEEAGHLGVRVLAEVAKPSGSASAKLVAFLVPSEAESLTEQRLKEAVSGMIRGLGAELTKLLPQYMVPEAYIPLAAVPKTSTGKTDRRRLREVIATVKLESLSGESKYAPPSTELEVVVQAIWADVLNIATTSISVEAGFRSLGDSIQAMQVVAKCRRRQINLTTESLMRLQTIRSICKDHKADHTADRRDQSIDTVPGHRFDLSPIQKWYFEKQDAKLCFDVPLPLVLQRRSSPKKVRKAMECLVARHSVLRARFEHFKGDWKQYIQSDNVGSSYSFEYHAVETETSLASVIKECRAGLDIENGPLIAARLIETEDSQLLFLTTHHLVMDYMSWRVLITDLDDLLSERSLTVEPATSHSFQQWVLEQAEHTRLRLTPELALPAGQEVLPAQLDYWDLDERTIRTKRYAVHIVTLDVHTTERIMGSPYVADRSVTPFELLMSALLYSFGRAFPDRPLPPCFAEGHGREPWPESEFDLSQTVGWFTTIFPIQLQTSRSRSLTDTIRDGAMVMRSLPNRGFDYMSTRYLHPRGPEVFQFSKGTFELNFNFLGTMNQFEKDDSLFRLLPLPEGSDPESALDCRPVAVFDVGAVIMQGKLQVKYKYACADQFVARLAEEYEKVLRSIAETAKA